MKPSDKLIQMIREQQIRPVPRWRFTLKNLLLWAAFAVAALLGALAFSVVLFAIQQTDFQVISHLSHSRLELFLGLLPFFWIALLIVFLLVAIYSIQHSPKGYKLTLARLVGYSAALSILLGALFFIAGGAQRLEQAFAVNVSLYESVQEKKARLWSMPEEGYLSGEIQQTSIGSFELEDFEGKTWTVGYEGAFIPPVVLLERGEKVKLLGKMDGPGRFEASEVRPWGGMERKGRRGSGLGSER
ncbi:MAG: hypothetical protein KDC66_20720 [Phaeodactylibacter sp.]|nr:hypothetical protein [Phaeodactylibacter sp.]MCB9277089.1 hypothetical protein [Lewinellaceae bacterium]